MVLNEENVKTGEYFTSVVANGTGHLLAVNKSMLSYMVQYGTGDKLGRCRTLHLIKSGCFYTMIRRMIIGV